MRKPTDYKERLEHAMSLSGMDAKRLASEIKVSYQAVKKVLDYKTKMLAADNNSLAAKAMMVDADWLATGDGGARPATMWPFSKEMLAAARSAGPTVRRQAENAARNVLNLDMLPRLETVAESA